MALRTPLPPPAFKLAITVWELQPTQRRLMGETGLQSLIYTLLGSVYAAP